jgi:membrane-bound lytic murein transglycosylase D
LNGLKKSHAEILAFIGYVLESKGIPKELKGLAVIESSLDNRTVSSAGAVGPWQFMPTTGREYGLCVNGSVDERYDIYKSTYAVTKMLKQLYAHYRDWDLVVAAFNCGAGHVDRAIAQSGSREFDKLQYYLPAESRNHVKKFIGTSYVMDGKILSGATSAPVPDRDTSRPDSASLAKSKLSFEYAQAGISLEKIAEKLDISLDNLKKWNASYGLSMEEHGYAWLVLPVDKVADFLFYKNEILQASLEKDDGSEKQTSQAK